MSWQHVRIRNGLVTVCATRFEVDADGILSPPPEHPEILRVLAASPNSRPVEGSTPKPTPPPKPAPAEEAGDDLESMGVKKLKPLAQDLGVYEHGMRKAAMIAAIRAARE